MDDDLPPTLLEGQFQELNKPDEKAEPNDIGKMIGQFFQLGNKSKLQGMLDGILKKEINVEEVKAYFLECLKNTFIDEAKQLTREKFGLPLNYTFTVELNVAFEEKYELDVAFNKK